MLQLLVQGGGLRFHVIISVKTKPPIISGNQPPSNSLSRFEAKKVKSTTKNRPSNAMHSASGSFQRVADHEEGQRGGDQHVGVTAMP
jgi:hypothetical protein